MKHPCQEYLHILKVNNQTLKNLYHYCPHYYVVALKYMLILENLCYLPHLFLRGIENLEIIGLNAYESSDLGWSYMGPAFSNLPLWEKVSINQLSPIPLIVIENIEVLNQNSLIESYKYNLRVKATDEFDNSLTHDLVISVKNIDESIKAITGSVKENTTAVHTFTKDDGVTWSIAEGDDKDK